MDNTKTTYQPERASLNKVPYSTTESQHHAVTQCRKHRKTLLPVQIPIRINCTVVLVTVLLF